MSLGATSPGAQRVDLGRLVEHAVGPQGQALAAHVGGGEVAQHHQPISLLQRLRRPQHAQARPALQEDVDDHQVDELAGVGEPAQRRRFILGRADDTHRHQLLERGDQVLADDRAVFDDVGVERRGHGRFGNGGVGHPGASARVADRPPRVCPSPRRRALGQCRRAM